ncbi:hypothetical protein Vadar_021285 [Vaccinium darrowii]|uniref:Uncharacterized protein n=1 Tax=Vaccinium darrowii TaxID=229202 RepID=A0ACB7ZDN4_9ERIC|nr:hypothetical protein Vadar_021285 [Vaccinium darrowii]
MVSVWEDESITFDALQNDYLAGGNICKHPRIFTAGSWFTTTVWKALPIYTPYKGFAGNDSFSYTISDVNSNVASGAVNISIISIPPQFVSIPNQLHAIEDLISPIFGPRNKFDFSIGDPDLVNFPGNDSHFLVMFSVEVSSGFLSTKLPADLISTTELKLKNSPQWQALQTFVTISRHFMVKARGIRFQGSVDDCNSILEQLLYHDLSDLLRQVKHLHVGLD